MLSPVLGSLDRTVNARLPAVMRIVVGTVTLWKVQRIWDSIGAAGELHTTAMPALLLPWLALVACIGLIVGVASRPAAALLTMLTFAAQEYTTQWFGHMYLLGLLLALLTLTPCDRALTIRPRRHQPEVPGWTMALARLQFTFVYAFAGITKANEDFVSGLAMNTFASTFAREHVFPDHLMGSAPLFVALSVSAIATELFIAAGVWTRWSRPLALGLIVPLHASMAVALAHSPAHAVDLVAFGVMMLLLAMPFVALPQGSMTLSHAAGLPARRSVAIVRRLDWLRIVDLQAVDDAPSPDTLVLECGRRRWHGARAVTEALSVAPLTFSLAVWLRLVSRAGFRQGTRTGRTVRLGSS